jgi:hypothetical protein
MNHLTPVRDYLSPEVQAEILKRIALARRFLDRLFSLACVGMLILIPVLFAVAHIAADGAAWDFATGEPFNPAFNVISAYAWRSPAGWAMVACMAGFAFVLGFISWHAAKRGPGFFSWLTAVSAAIAMALLLQSAWVPFKPDKETFSRIQMELTRESTHEAKLAIWSGGLYALGSPLPAGATSPTYFKSLRHHWIHNHALGCAQVFVLVAFMSASFIWTSKRPDGRFWRGFLFWAEWVVLIFVVAGVAGQLWLPEYNGLTQRIMYFGFYLWLLVIVREILRQRQDATVTDRLLQS